MPDTTRYRSTCLAPDCGGRLVVADDGAWHHVGPHGAGLHRPQPADPTPAEEAAYQQGLLVGFRESLDAITADPDHAEQVLLRAARNHGVELTTTTDPEPGVVAAYMEDGSHDPASCGGSCRQAPDAPVHEPPSCGCGGQHWSCPDAEDEVDPADSIDPVARRSAAADRMSWTSGAGLIITPPPPADPS